MKQKKMTKLAVLVIALVLSITAAFPVSAFAAGYGTIPVEIEAARYDAAASQVVELVNEERAKYNLAALRLDSDLQEAAMIRAAESIVYFAHVRPDGTGCWTVNPSAIAGENLAVAQTSPQQVMNAWMNSELHRANILSDDYYGIGIGCVNYNGTWYWSQCFGRMAGDQKTSDTISDMTHKVNLMTSLVQLKWLGEDKIDLAAEAGDESRKVQIAGVNAGWEYGTYNLDPALLVIESSDENVLRVEEDGTLTPVSLGTAVITVSLEADPACQLEQEIRVVRSLKAEDVTLSRTSYTYNGKAKKPAVTVEGLTEDDYVISYKNNVKVGNATVTITGVGDVDGTVKKTFKINYDRPGQVSMKKPTTGSDHYVKVRWNDEECDGYQIRYATNSSFKNSKSIYVKDGDQLSRTIKKLKEGKRYYVKVRAYNNYEDTKVFGKWSKWKSIKCK